MEGKYINRVLSVLKNGEKATAYQLNQRCGFNDSRKAISLLRGKGYDIADYRLSNRCKVYFLHTEQ